MGDAREAHWLTRKSLRGQGVSGPVSEPRTHANQTRPTTQMQPAADCGQTAVATHLLRVAPVSHQSSVINRRVVSYYHPPTLHPLHTTGRTQVAGPGARALCLDPGFALGPGHWNFDLDLDLGRLKIGTANTSQFLSECTQSQSDFSCNISLVGCCPPIATTLPQQNMSARLDLYTTHASTQPLSKPSPFPHHTHTLPNPGQHCASSAQIDFFRVPA